MGAALPLGLAWLAQRFDTTPDLGERLGASGAALAYRAGMVFLALATLAPLPPHPAPATSVARPRAALHAACSASPSVRSSSPAALCDRTPVALALLLIGAATAISAAKSQRGAPSGRWLTALVLTCLIAAVSWEIPYRSGLRSRWARDLAALSGPALDARAVELADEMEAFLHSARAREIVAMPTTPGAGRDLAVALWRGSPLARRDVASAVQVDVGAAEPSLFSYGLTVRDGEIDPESFPAAGVRADHWIDGGATVVPSGASDTGPSHRPSCSGSCRWRRRPGAPLRGARDRSAARPPRGGRFLSPRRRFAGGARG